jgi:hypothetical protein
MMMMGLWRGVIMILRILCSTSDRRIMVDGDLEGNFGRSRFLKETIGRFRMSEFAFG